MSSQRSTDSELTIKDTKYKVIKKLDSVRPRSQIEPVVTGAQFTESSSGALAAITALTKLDNVTFFAK